MSDIEEIAHAIAGAGGGALSMIVTYPLVTLLTLAQTSQKKKEAAPAEGAPTAAAPRAPTALHYRVLDAITRLSLYRAAQLIIREKGVTGLYLGLESALYGITLTNFIYYYFYEFTSNIFLRSNALGARSGKGLLTLQLIATGAVAGAITCIGLNPFWVANTRTMTKRGEGKTTSTFGALLDIVQNDGFGTLFAGVFPALVLVLNPIIQYTIFEQIKNLIIAKNGKRSFTPVKAFFIGAFGKLIATTLTYPYITLKSRMHIKKKKLARADDKDAAEVELSMIQEIKKILREEGVDGLYGGLVVKLVQLILTAAFLFYFKEELLVGSVKLVEMFRFLRLKRSIERK
jgi:adenine nucleotide transporter 17